VWKEWCSWGYYALLLEFQFPDGSTHLISKKERGWDKNFPDAFLIQPNGYFVMPVKLREEWPDIHSKGRKMRLRAHYRISPDDKSKEERVWSGEIVSQWIDVTVYD
jgi:hypothetical protein